MVKVVGRDESVVRRVTCRSCASILEYTLSEVDSYVDHDYGGGSDTVYYIRCPSCGNTITGLSRY